MTKNGHFKLIQSPIFLAGLLFVLALLVRLPYLNTFLTIDEYKWVAGAVEFISALDNGHLAQTYWHFFPGITTTWLEVFILWLQWLIQGSNVSMVAFATTQLENLGHTIGLMRLSQVLITAFIIPGIYLLARPLVGNLVALLGALLLVLDPFYLGHSRIVNGDSGAAGFMLLSILAFLWLWQDGKLRMAVLSGAMGGLAMLTKLPAPVLVPWIGILALVGYLKWKKQPGFWIKTILLWGGTAALVFILLWPAMWVAPVNTLQQMYQDTFEVGEAGEGHNTFFMDQISNDPGWFFYPIAIAFRLTPITSVGLLVAIFWLMTKSKDDSALSRWIGWSLVAYVLFVVLAASFSAKKLDRYVMAVFPALNVLIAIGLWGIWQRLTTTNAWLSRSRSILFIALLIGLQGIFTLIHYPYLLTGYNPLWGGASQAVSTVPVGWGEGLEQAALYLNSLPDAESFTVSSWYSDIFQPYFVGQWASFSDDGRGQLSADYVVFYINQMQRQKPYAGLIDYFRNGEPVFVLDIPAEDQTSRDQPRWVEVYKAPAAQSASGAPKVEGVAKLLAYKIGNTAPENASSELLPGNNLDVTLFFHTLGPLPPDTSFGVALILLDSDQGPKWGDWQPATPTGQWFEDNVIEWAGHLRLPADMPAGQYRLAVTFQFEEGSVIAEFPISDNDPPLNIE